MSVYKVTGRFAYRGHQPGETFTAKLDQATEIRAIQRGNIVVIDSSPTRLRPGSYRLPDGWQTEPIAAPKRGFSF